MLMKLMKHEFRATGRSLLPMFLAVLVLSFGASLSVRFLDGATNPVIDALLSLFVIGYGIALVGVFMLVFVLMISRFRSNLLKDEGYVMFTLPVSVHQLIWSKIIVSCLWFVAACVVVVISAFIVAFDVEIFTSFGMVFRELWSDITAYYALNGIAIFIEFLILCFVGYAAGCLQFYAAMATGYGFDRRKGLMSVLFFFGFQFVLQFVTMVPMFMDSFGGFMNSMFYGGDPMMSIHLGFGLSIFFTVVVGAVFYVITTQMLKRRLNLE